jgi:hypothetical protein
MRKYGLLLGVAVGAMVLTGCGGGSKASANPSTNASTPATSDSGNPGPTTSATGKAKAKGKVKVKAAAKGAKCGTATVAAGTDPQGCAHVTKVFQIYATKKSATGAGKFSGWDCKKVTAKKIISCTKGTLTIHEPSA